MSADNVIQFIPRPNPNREASLLAQATSLVDFINGLTAKDAPYTETESYCAPDKDSA